MSTVKRGLLSWLLVETHSLSLLVVLLTQTMFLIRNVLSLKDEGLTQMLRVSVHAALLAVWCGVVSVHAALLAVWVW